MSRNEEIAPSIQAKLSSYQVRWLNKQCDKLKSKEGEVLTEAFDEWLVRHSDQIIQTGEPVACAAHGIKEYRSCVLLICRCAHKSESELFDRLRST